MKTQNTNKLKALMMVYVHGTMSTIEKGLEARHEVLRVILLSAVFEAKCIISTCECSRGAHTTFHGTPVYATDLGKSPALEASAIAGDFK
jgi:hypothetical protein